MNLMKGDCLELMSELDESSVDSIVTDPPYGLEFMGSGTTGIAAYEEGFKFIGFEKNEEYVTIARARINCYTDQTKL